MAHGDLLVKRSKSSSEGRGGVPLHEHQCRGERLEVVAEALKCCTGHMGEGLTRRHQIEIAVGLQTEQVHDLSHHLPVLPGEDHTGLQAIAGLKLLDHRGELDRFRPGSQDDRHPRQTCHTALKPMNQAGSYR